MEEKKNEFCANNGSKDIAYTLISFNLCNGFSRANLWFQGSQEERMQGIADLLVSHDADAIALQEFAPAHCDGLIAGLEEAGYRMFYPEGYSKETDFRMTAVTILAVKEGVSFDQEYRAEIELSYRYIAGSLKKDKEEKIKIFAPHIPTLGEKASTATMKRKCDMLYVARKYFEECSIIKRQKCILMGDLNSEVREAKISNLCGDEMEFAQLKEFAIDTSVNRESTFQATRLDYCFVNELLNSDYIVKTYERKNIYSDHSYLEVQVKRR